MEVTAGHRRSQGLFFGIGGTLFSLFPFFLFLFLLLAIAGGGAGSAGGEADRPAYITTGTINLSPKCERYRSLVEKYAGKYGMDGFVDVILAMMMQESGGDSERYPDVMQSSEYAGWAPNTITDVEVSIDYGVQAVRDAMLTAGCTSPSQTDLLKLSLQGYNFGSGYVSWALQRYGGYSKENALEFSGMMAAKLGWSRYGDPLYVDHIFQYLVFNTEGAGGASYTGITDPEVQRQLAMLEENWPDMDERRKAVLAKGATRIGKTTYDMYGSDTRSGIDEPRTLDCSSFVAWAFQKSGFGDVPYASVTGNFLNPPFYPISADELMPGDIGLKNTIFAGGDNHVGFYAGTDGNGNQMWMHCSSAAFPGSNIVSGPRINYYTNFYIYYRYGGFLD